MTLLDVGQGRGGYRMSITGGPSARQAPGLRIPQSGVGRKDGEDRNDRAFPGILA